MSDKLYRAIMKEGTHLASSKETVGAYRGTLLDDETNILLGQAEWVEVEQISDDESDADKVLMLVMGIGIGIVAFKATPYIIKWYKKNLLPTAEKMWCKLSKREYFEKQAGIENDSHIYILEFNKALNVYLEKFKQNTLDYKTVDDLVAMLDILIQNQERNSIVIKISIEQFSTIMDIMVSITQTIQSNNIILFEKFKGKLEDRSELGKLRYQLEMQKFMLNQVV